MATTEITLLIKNSMSYDINKYYIWKTTHKNRFSCKNRINQKQKKKKKDKINL